MLILSTFFKKSGAKNWEILCNAQNPPQSTKFPGPARRSQLLFVMPSAYLIQNSR